MFLSGLIRTFTIHRVAREGGGYLFNSSPPLPPASHMFSTIQYRAYNAPYIFNPSMLVMLNLIQVQTRGKSWALSSSFLAFLIVSRSSSIVIQPKFTSFCPQMFRLTDLDNNSKLNISQLYKYNF